MASAAPDSIRMPAAEGVGARGLDGMVEVSGGAPPYLPAGRSVWEIGTGSDPAAKAESDYLKRTAQLSDEARAATTFVFVTSRNWSGAAAWAAGKAAGADGWADVKAIEAQDLATWLERCPGTHAVISEHLGRQPFGVTPLRRWHLEWSEQTEPPVPVELLLCGRHVEARALSESLGAAANEQLIASGSRDEAVAFVAATLLAKLLTDAPAPDGGTGERPVDPPTAADEDDPAGAPDQARREALLERTLVVHDEAAWRRCVSYDRPVILVPLFDDANVGAALRNGHHVVLARAARPTDNKPLPPLHREQARRAWEAAGVPFPKADDLARAARRSLTSLRRRIGRSGRFRQPQWAEGTTASLLATVLPAGAWRDDMDGDRDVITALADRRSWRSVGRDLAPLTMGEDAPLAEHGHRWEFVDVIDAWDSLGSALTSEDLDVFREQAERVLTERDPVAALPEAERRARALSIEGLPKREYSNNLRTGIATTLAVLGAKVRTRTLPGGHTGEEHARRVVRTLLHGADDERWVSLADLLPLLAEAAPTVFLDAVEASLGTDPVPVMALFAEHDDPAGLAPRSSHSPLLWGLEALAFSPQHLSRAAVVLARLAERDPGGRLANRPSASLQSLLHLVMPQSAVTPASRVAVIDVIRAEVPDAAWPLLVGLVRSLDGGMIVHRGPRFHDWSVPAHPRVNYGEVAEALGSVGDRIAEDAGSNAARWADAMRLITELPVDARTVLLDRAKATWAELGEGRPTVAKALLEQVRQHQSYPEAEWALREEALRPLVDFLEEHGYPCSSDEPTDNELFSWLARRRGRDMHDAPEELAAAREAAVRRAIAETGLGGVLQMAGEVEMPWAVGTTLADVTDEVDEDVVDLLGGEDLPAHQMAAGFAARRQDNDRGWLAQMIAGRPDQAVPLLLTAEIDQPILDLVDGLTEEVRGQYWSQVQPWRTPDSLIDEVIRRLLDRGRPFSAMVLLQDRAGSRPFPAALALEVANAPRNSPPSERLDAIPSPQYVIGEVLEKLASAGVGDDDLATLEWFYLPLLDHRRTPDALHRRLAKDPEFFAEIVSLVYRAEPEDDAATTGPADSATTDAIPDSGGDSDAAPKSQEHVTRAAWTLLHEWRSPLPGTDGGELPTSEQAQAWVTAARAALASRRRGHVASVVIGEALSGPFTDVDGVWPSEPVRAVLEHEQDRRLEEGFAIGRFNQRGVTFRSPYSGGDQERLLARQYREWADKIRDDWPRAGAVLDDLANGYEADARREDASAERNSNR